MAAARFVAPAAVPESLCWLGHETDYWRKREARTEGDDAPEVPSTQNRVRCSTCGLGILAFPNRNGVIHAGDPALAVIEVR